ncbi:RNA methyltransferase [Thiohalobacter sp. IOR34]|uniref:RNA methyltransferase n=1 Tax=Thiohalobacter sp. IOR34 TaxID=3057176 RepID=UPI0025AED581|nr:RNA methyltransferase [Thiohalobacter sp. IOR34]WJW76405.1 RNA methyltransferase [Thiohalobacter sp. IOR34]
MGRLRLAFARSDAAGLLSAALTLILLMLSGCVPPDDEAALVLEDLAAGGGDSRLKRRTPHPTRMALEYAIAGRSYRGDLYRSGEQARAGIVLVPGVAERGKEDPRLVAFANTLARARFLVLVPELPNLRALRVRAGDAQGVADAFCYLLARQDFPAPGRAGIGAFSYAVGPAVLAALRPEIRDRLDFLLGVGGYYDLERVVTFATTGYSPDNGQWDRRETNLYGKWVFVLSNVELLSDPEDREAFRIMARRKLADPGAAIDDLVVRLTVEGRALLALLENRDPQRVAALLADLPAAIRAEMDALNLSNKDLSRLEARLILLHGRDDDIIPYTESMSLAAAVPKGRAELFVIDGLAHVDVRPLGLDQRSLWRAIRILLAERDGRGEHS